MNAIKYFEFGYPNSPILYLKNIITTINIIEVSFGYTLYGKNAADFVFDVVFTNDEFILKNSTIIFKDKNKFQQALNVIKTNTSNEFAKIAVKLKCSNANEHLNFVASHVPEFTNRSTLFFSCDNYFVKQNEIVVQFISPEDIIVNDKKLVIKFANMRKPFPNETPNKIRYCFFNNSTNDTQLFFDKMNTLFVTLYDNTVENNLIVANKNYNRGYVLNVSVDRVSEGNNVFWNINFVKDYYFYQFSHFCNIKPSSVVESIAISNDTDEYVTEAEFTRQLKYSLVTITSQFSLTVESDKYEITFKLYNEALIQLASFMYANSWNLYFQNWGE